MDTSRYKEKDEVMTLLARLEQSYIQIVNDDGTTGERFDEDKAIKAIEKDILEYVIGEDEIDREFDHQEQADLYIIENVHRNKLRAELRQKLTEYIRGE